MKRILLSALALAVPLSALADVTILFTEPGSSTFVNSLAVGPVGTTFTVSIWYQSSTSFQHNVSSTFVAFAQAAEDNVPVAPKVEFQSTPAASIGNINPLFQLSFAGANREGGTTAPELALYGLDSVFETLDGVNGVATGSPVRLFDLTLVNVGVTIGNDGGLTVPNSLANEGATYLSYAEFIERTSAASSLTLTAVPEPASMAVLGLGLAALKRRRSVKK